MTAARPVARMGVTGVAMVMAVVAAPAVATAGAGGVVRAVHTDVGEINACLPVADGGFLAGTGGGLVAVDGGGVARQVWTAVDGLPGTRVHALVVDGERLWVGTEGGAAEVAISGARLAVKRTVPSKPVRDLVRWNGAVYLATWEGGVRKVGAGATSTAVAFRGGKAIRSRVAALAVADGRLWAGTAAGLYQLVDGRFEVVALGGAATVATAVTAVHGLYVEGDRLWIATSDGLFRRDAGDGAIRSLGGGDLRRVTALDGGVVAAGLGAGLVRVDRGRLTTVVGAPRELVMAQALAGAAGQGGAACAGGLDGLWLRVAAGAPWQKAPLRAGPPASDVSALAVDGPRLWVGTFDRGLAILERGAWRRVEDPQLDRRINALAVETRRGAAARIWVGTASGLSVIEPDGSAPRGVRIRRLGKRDGLPSRTILAVTVLRDGRVLVGTGQGAVLVGAGRPVGLGVKQGLDIGNVWAVAEDDAGWLWLGTTTGVYRGRAPAADAGDDDGAWLRLSVATGHLRDDWVMALAPHDGAMFVGTYKGGVTRLDVIDVVDETAAISATGAATIRATPLGAGWVNPGGLRWIGDTLYAATMEGLLLGDATSPTWRSAPAGTLPGRDTTAAVAAGDRLWVATRRGIVELTR